MLDILKDVCINVSAELALNTFLLPLSVLPNHYVKVGLK